MIGTHFPFISGESLLILTALSWVSLPEPHTERPSQSHRPWDWPQTSYASFSVWTELDIVLSYHVKKQVTDACSGAKTASVSSHIFVPKLVCTNQLVWNIACSNSLQSMSWILLQPPEANFADGTACGRESSELPVSSQLWLPTALLMQALRSCEAGWKREVAGPDTRSNHLAF